MFILEVKTWRIANWECSGARHLPKALGNSLSEATFGLRAWDSARCESPETGCGASLRIGLVEGTMELQQRSEILGLTAVGLRLDIASVVRELRSLIS